MKLIQVTWYQNICIKPKSKSSAAIIIFLDVLKIMVTGLKDKAHGGEFETIFRHGDEAENSICLALFPEFVQMENVEDTKTWGFLPEGHI